MDAPTRLEFHLATALFKTRGRVGRSNAQAFSDTSEPKWLHRHIANTLLGLHTSLQHLGTIAFGNPSVKPLGPASRYTPV